MNVSYMKYTQCRASYDIEGTAFVRVALNG